MNNPGADAVQLLDGSISHLHERAVELDGANQRNLVDLKTTRVFLEMLDSIGLGNT